MHHFLISSPLIIITVILTSKNIHKPIQPPLILTQIMPIPPLSQSLIPYPLKLSTNIFLFLVEIIIISNA